MKYIVESKIAIQSTERIYWIEKSKRRKESDERAHGSSNARIHERESVDIK